jgi:hypothetical protein
MFIPLDSVVEAARRRLAALTPEVAGYVVLLAARELEIRPSRVALAGILLTDAGDVQVRSDPEASVSETEADLRAVLSTLLELSPSPVPAITAVAETSPSGSLSTFIVELSAALIPINHAAAHRALARLYRETLRAGALAAETAPAPASLEPSAASVAVLELGSRDVEDVEDVEDGSELTLAPPPVTANPPRERIRDLDIVVGLDAETEPESGLATGGRLPPVELRVAAAPPITDGAMDRSHHHSDVRELLQRFLADARCDARMASTLRAMIDLEPCTPAKNGPCPSALTASVSG